jgi:hypothetical protein
MSTLPHFTFVGAFLLLMAIQFTQFLRTRKVIHITITLAASLAIIPIQPFSLLIGDILCVGVLLGHWRADGRYQAFHLFSLLIIVFAQLPFLVFNLIAIRGDPIWAGMADQLVMLSPSPIHFILGFGFLIPFAVWGFWLVWQKRNTVGIMALTWVLAAMILAYVPSNLQRRFTLDLSIPIGLLAAYAIWRGFSPCLHLQGWRFPHSSIVQSIVKRRELFQLLIVILPLFSTMYLIGGGALLARTRSKPLFDSRSVVEAVHWIAEQAVGNDAVFAAPRTGLLIPPQTGLHVFIGHPIETVWYETKRGIVEEFFRREGMTATERMKILEECGCNWVVVGPYEREIGNLDEASLDGLERVYTASGIHVYHVRR